MTPARPHSAHRRSAVGELARWRRALPTLLRVGAAEAMAYRVEFLIWMLTNTLPLVMLGLWSSVAAEAPFRGFAGADFAAYYLAALIVRMVTGSWVVWQVNEEVRTGGLSMRLLRPMHPFITYAAVHLSAIPLRAVIALPIALVMLVSAAGTRIATDAALLAVFALALPGAWALTYLTMLIIGALSFWLERSIAVFDIYLGVSAVLSGYLLPLELLPTWLRRLGDYLPFRYMLAFPIETLLGSLDRRGALMQLGLQWGFVALLSLLALTLWRAGLRRYEAYGA